MIVEYLLCLFFIDFPIMSKQFGLFFQALEMLNHMPTTDQSTN